MAYLSLSNLVGEQCRRLNGHTRHLRLGDLLNEFVEFQPHPLGLEYLGRLASRYSITVYSVRPPTPIQPYSLTYPKFSTAHLIRESLVSRPCFTGQSVSTCLPPWTIVKSFTCRKGHQLQQPSENTNNTFNIRLRSLGDQKPFRCFPAVLCLFLLFLPFLDGQYNCPFLSNLRLSPAKVENNPKFSLSVGVFFKPIALHYFSWSGRNPPVVTN